MMAPGAFYRGRCVLLLVVGIDHERVVLQPLFVVHTVEQMHQLDKMPTTASSASAWQIKPPHSKSSRRSSLALLPTCLLQNAPRMC